ncbi:hypothetical protein ILYODFUR_014383 [Ilyodon furcidens]|uniref:Uncharacterized protein n=1 Tax=Ilyodon furcidens TaxID=33524 RepID=A0ABV0UGZ4_9TELE
MKDLNLSKTFMIQCLIAEILKAKLRKLHSPPVFGAPSSPSAALFVFPKVPSILSDCTCKHTLPQREGCAVKLVSGQTDADLHSYTDSRAECQYHVPWVICGTVLHKRIHLFRVCVCVRPICSGPWVLVFCLFGC